MIKVTKYFIVYLVLDVLLLLFGLFNLPAVHERAKVPFAVEKTDNHLVVSRILRVEACPELHEGDRIIQWNWVHVQSADEIEFLCDLSAIDETIQCTYQREGKENISFIRLVSYYESPRFAVIMTIVGFIIWCMALFVAFNRLEGGAAHLLHGALVTLAITLLLTQGKISPNELYSLANRIGLITCYLLTASLFLLFSFLYPRNKYGPVWLKSTVIFILSGGTIGITSYWFIESTKSPFAIPQFLHTYDLYHVLLAVYGTGIILSVLHSYIRARSQEDRSRLQWILWGFTVGQIPFLLFIVLPQLLFTKDWIPEEYAIVFLLAAPFSFAVSFVKYRLFDVQVMINRSIVYTLLSMMIGAIYLLLVFLGVTLIGGEAKFSEYLVVMCVTIVLAWIFNPLRLRLQRIIDETLFPARTNISNVITKLTEDFRKIVGKQELAQTTVDICREKIPHSAISLFLLEDGTSYAQYPQNILVKHIIVMPPEISAQLRDRKILSLPSAVSHVEERFNVSYPEWLKSIGTALVVPLISESGSLSGIISAGLQRGDDKFAWEEIALLDAIAVQIAEILDRFALHKQIILEQEERQKIEELNRMKSYFVSSVSHELQTPLTSIRMYIESLLHGTIKSEKKKIEYYTIIDQESVRLSRMIDHVLEFSRIERGVREYRFAPTDLIAVVKKAEDAVRYQYEKNGMKLKLQLPKNVPGIEADGDALEGVVINLLSNASKYAGNSKSVNLKLKSTRAEISIQVDDKGIGIPENEVKRIFEPFYRVQKTGAVSGMGLGLQLVKHIVDAHGGKIEVISAPRKGTRFIVRLPIPQRSEGKKK